MRGHRNIPDGIPGDVSPSKGCLAQRREATSGEPRTVVDEEIGHEEPLPRHRDDEPQRRRRLQRPHAGREAGPTLGADGPYVVATLARNGG